MGYALDATGMNAVLSGWARDYKIYAPIIFPEGGRYSDADVVRYGEVTAAEEIVFHAKSEYSFKEFILPLSQTLFFFTEDAVKEADIENSPKGAIIFLRSCDLHAVKRLDQIYLRNNCEDYYYRRLREKIKFVLIGCREGFASCFCVDMGTNRSDGYDAGVDFREGLFLIDNQNAEWEILFAENATRTENVEIPCAEFTRTRVTIADDLSIDVMDSPMWKEYDARCINCGRCNFVCPTCTCFSMQDIFYTDNGRAGERRRVWASCMVDGYTEVAGGGAYRKTNGQRMRFKNLHKIYDYKKRYGYHMCVGCGRCDDICPEYISFSESVNRLGEAMAAIRREAAADGGK